MLKPTPGNSEAGALSSDAALVLAVRRGDKRAFVEIVTRYQAMVCGIALGILGDFAASEDAGQEAFLTAWRKFQDLREPARLRAWLGQIARNAALGQLRRKRGHDSLDEDLSLPDESPTPDEAAATEDEAALVRQMLAKLPEAHRLPLILYYCDGHSVRTMAEALGISEDAAKQRLARGREMLHDRMSGLLEKVLTRAKPSAIFTMTIAVAIGALAAPSTVTAGVLAASATTGATAATGSTTSFLTIMSTSKAALITAGLVAVCCIPIGYQLTAARTPTREVHVAATATNETLAAAPKTAHDFEGSPLFAEWRELHQRYGTNALAMPELYKAINKLDDPFRRLGFRSALISEWVRVDPKSGLTYFLGKVRDDAQRKQFLQEWLTVDPQAAVDALKNGGKGWDALARDCLTDIARKLPGSVPEIAALLPKEEEYWDNNVRDAFAILAQGGLPSARKAAEAMSGPSRVQALSGVAQVWAATDLDGAINWAKGLPEGTDRNEIIRAALIGKAAVDPAAALDRAGLVPAGGRYAYFANTTGARILAAAGEANFDATLGWLGANPGKLSSDELLGLVEPITEKLNADAAGFLSAHVADASFKALVPAIENALMNSASGQRQAVWDWLKTQPGDDPSLLALKTHVIVSAGWQDPLSALTMAADLPKTAEGDTIVKATAESLFNGGRMLFRYDQVMAQAPERLRQPIVEAAFELVSGETLDDPQKWIQRLGQLPDASRTHGTESIARAWAQQTPEDAVSWASTLPTGDAKTGAEAAITQAWAKKDSRGASDYVASLPAGTERDHSAESLVTAVAQNYPNDAWKWAMSIGDTTVRDRAAAEAIKGMAARDLATARQWIESGPFSDQTRAALQASLQKTGGPAL